TPPPRREAPPPPRYRRDGAVCAFGADLPGLTFVRHSFPNRHRDQNRCRNCRLPGPRILPAIPRRMIDTSPQTCEIPPIPYPKSIRQNQKSPLGSSDSSTLSFRRLLRLVPLQITLCHLVTLSGGDRATFCCTHRAQVSQVTPFPVSLCQPA